MNKKRSTIHRKDIDVKINLYCPDCGTLHIDRGWYALKPHRWHLCYNCRKKFWVSELTIGVGKF